MLNDVRRLASVGTIDRVRPIPEADAIEVGTVRGWDVVIGKGEFSDGDTVVYIEPDAALPVDDPRFASLAPRGVKTIDGRTYHVLKTVRLRGQLSQGIVYPAARFPECADPDTLDAALGIVLYEAPQPPLGADQIGPWNLAWLLKTDAERVQNLDDAWLAGVDDGGWVATEKIDGTSVTYALGDDGELHLYSRNFELAASNPAATPVALAGEYGIREWLVAHGVTAIQGEMYGNMIQDNRLRVTGHRLGVFAAWTRDGTRAIDRFDLLVEGCGLPVVPRVDVGFPPTVGEALALADKRKSLINPERLAEGIVWHHLGDQTYPELDYRVVFKAVSPAYLLKHGL